MSVSSPKAPSVAGASTPEPGPPSRRAPEWWRRRRFAALLTVLTMLAGTAALIDRRTFAGSPVRAQAVHVVRRHVVETPALPCTAAAPTTAEGYQHMFDSLNGDWAGGDQALSAALPDGRTLWIFGETVAGQPDASGGYAPGWTTRHNSFVMQSSGCLTPTRPDAPGVVPDAIPPVSADEWYQPYAAVVHGARLYVFAARVLHDVTVARTEGAPAVSGAPGGAPGGAINGASMAVYDLPYRSDPVLARVVALPTTPTPRGDVVWGAGAVGTGGWVDVYGTVAAPASEDAGQGTDVYLARAPVDTLADPSTWTYFDGRTFVRSAAASPALRPVLGASEGATAPLSVLADGTRTLLLAREAAGMGANVLGWTARTPGGPFSPLPTPLFDVRGAHQGEQFYTAQAHAEAVLDSGALLVSISRNNVDVSRVQADHLLFRPQFVAVWTLPRATP